MKNAKSMLATFLLVPLLLSASDEPFYPGAKYNPSVPTPKSVLGYAIGEYFTDHYQMEQYIRALEQARPERVKVIPIGQSVERRNMYLVIISAPENMQRLEAIRQAVGRLRDPRQTTPAEAQRIAETTPAIAWMNYANDGNESAAFEASLQVAYHFAAGEDEETLSILKNAVIVLNPAHNPESHQRYIAWMKASVVGPNGTADRNAAEHHGDWRMSTNNNHYQIDLNRDAFAASQRETQIVVEQLQRWHPQVFVDHHGETNEYFFAPYAIPVNTNLPPTTKKWAEIFGQNNSRAFDHYGWTYFAREVFDLHYPGYWDSYPALNGAIGMTYETDGGGRKGLRFERADGTILTFRDGIHHHVVASITTIKTAAENHTALLRDYYDFFRTGMEEARKEPIKLVALVPDKRPDLTRALVELLLRHRIEVYQTQAPVTLDRAVDYLTGQRLRKTLPAGSYLIPMEQPQKRLAKTLLERDTRIEKAFLKIARENYEYNHSVGEKAPKERLGFYDVTAWSLPLAYGIEAYGAPRMVRVAMKRVDRVTPPEGGIAGGTTQATYGYAFSANTVSGMRLLARLLANDYRVAISRKPVHLENQTFPPGTALLRIKRNPANLRERLQGWAKELRVTVTPLTTAWTPKGIFWGSSNLIPLKKPRIAVITEEPTRQTSYGAIWFVLEKQYGIPFTAIRLDYFQRVNLYDYNVLVLPPGNAAGYEKALGKAGIQKIKQWIQNGGVFVGIKEGAAFATREKVKWTTARLLGQKPASTAKGEKSGATPDTAKKSIKPDFTPGAILKVKLDTNHLLALGYDEIIPVLVYSNQIFTPSKEGANVGRFVSKDVRVSGFVWEKTEKLFPEKAYLIHEPMGRGHVILFAEEPIFRTYWRGLEKLFLNGLLIGPSLSMISRRY